jgi:LysR family transcriptional regulator, regulator for bpeEF and oprC
MSRQSRHRVATSSSVSRLLAFSAAARHASFAAAARELTLSPSAVVKSVARLERELGVRLFHRTTRKLRLTEEGDALFQRCLRVLAELADLQTAVANTRGVSGTLRLDVPVAYGKLVVLPLLAALGLRHPVLGIDVRLSDAFNDPIEGGYDAVVRIGGAHDSRLIARVVDHSEIGVFAAPDYLALHEEPRQLSSLKDHNCLGYRLANSGRGRAWQFRVGGQPHEIQPSFRHLISDGEGLVAAAVVGLGLIQVPRFMAIPASEAGSLREVLRPFEPEPLPISVQFASRRQVPARLRVFIEALSNRAP